MKTLQNTLAVAWNEIQVLFKDRGALAILLALPLVIAGLLNAPQIASWGSDVPEVSFHLMVVNQDEGLYGEQMVDALQGIDILQVELLHDPIEADQRVTDREAETAVIIPPTFSQQINNHEQTTVQVIVDPTQETTVGLVTGILDSVLAEIALVGEIQYGIRSIMAESEVFVNADPAMQQGVAAQTLGVIMTRLNERRDSPAIAVNSQDMAGKSLVELRNITIVAMMPGVAILFSFFVTTALIDSFYKEKDQGSFRRLIASPISRGAIVVGKMTAYVIIVFLQVGIMIVISNLLFDMPIGESPWVLFVITLVLALAVTALGMFLTAVSRTQKQADAWAMVFALVLGAIGGTIHGLPVPFVYRTSGFLGTLSRLTPQGNAMEAIVSVMGEGAGFVDVLPQIGIMMGIAVLFYAIAIWRFRFE